MGPPGPARRGGAAPPRLPRAGLGRPGDRAARMVARPGPL